MRITLYILLITFFFSCRPKADNEFEVFNEKLSYRFLKFGEGDKVELGKVIQLYMVVLDRSGDSLHYVPKYPYFMSIGNHPIDSVLMKFAEGDSIHLLVHRKLFNEYLKLYGPSLSDTGEVEVHASIQKVLSKKSKSRIRQKLLSQREVEEQKALREYLATLPTETEDLGEVYRIVTHRTRGDSLAEGDQLTISYKGRFLDGYVFDDTEEKGISPTFTFGREYQLVPGVEKGLMGLREGESVKIILPSRQAFGEQGSLAGIVPPYTTVIFDIEILKVEKQKVKKG